MKNLVKTIVLVALAASCAKETGIESIPDAATRRYNLSFAESTKTELSGTGSTRQVNWNSGDAIKYYTEPGQANAASANVALKGNNAYIDIQPGRADVLINAVYGATQLSSGSSTENTMYVNSPVKNNQSYTSFSQAHICAAFSDDIENPNLTFHNAAAILKFTSAATIHKIVFRGNNDEVITAGSNGSLKITHSSGALTVEPAQNGGTSVTVQTNGAESDFYIAVLPVNFSGGITVDCYDSNLELIATKKTTNAVNTVSASGTPKVLNLGNVQDWLNNPLPVAVDLGLSVKWARTNLGATVPEEYGDYFAWGETEPRSASSFTQYWTAYKWCNGSGVSLTKYCYGHDYGRVDNIMVLEPADDAATVNLGSDWRTPTSTEIEELLNNCSWEYTTLNDVPGYRVTSLVSGYTDKSIFLPFPIFDNDLYKDLGCTPGTLGLYWSSSLYPQANQPSSVAYCLAFLPSDVLWDCLNRFAGFPIRPVYGEFVTVSAITLDKSSIELLIGDSAQLTTTISPSNATAPGVRWVSGDETIVSVDETGNITAVAVGATTVTAYASNGLSASCVVTVKEKPTINGYEYVDLGLPSGLKWATKNVGATKPEEYGEYFAWGETEPKSIFDWSTYKFELGTSWDGPFSKYVNSPDYGTVDNKTVLDPEDDAAHVNWGGSWHMPTDAEWTELRTKCTWTRTTQNGVSGRLVTGPNGKSIFFPAAGGRYDTYLGSAGSNGLYWSSSLYTGYPYGAWYVYFSSDDVYWIGNYRCYGFSVRPVSE